MGFLWSFTFSRYILVFLSMKQPWMVWVSVTSIKSQNKKNCATLCTSGDAYWSGSAGHLFTMKRPSSYWYRILIINLIEYWYHLRFIMGIPIPTRRRLIVNRGLSIGLACRNFVLAFGQLEIYRPKDCACICISTNTNNVDQRKVGVQSETND